MSIEPFRSIALIASIVLFVLAAIFAWDAEWATLACAGLAAFAAAHLP